MSDNRIKVLVIDNRIIDRFYVEFESKLNSDDWLPMFGYARQIQLADGQMTWINSQGHQRGPLTVRNVRIRPGQHNAIKKEK